MLDLIWFLWKHEEVTFWCFNHTNTLKSGFQGENGWISRWFSWNLVVLHGNLDFPCSRLTCIENNPFWATPWWLMNENFLSPNVSSYANITLQGTNISPKNGILKMIFLFPRWDMLIPWRVSFFFPMAIPLDSFSTVNSCRASMNLSYWCHCQYQRENTGTFGRGERTLSVCSLNI